MSRRYAVAYDISDDKRRTAVFKTLQGYGDHAQFSVFFCELSQMDLVRLRSTLREAIHEKEDQVMLIDLGRTDRSFTEDLEVLGRPYEPSVRSIVV
jgi:CRISPR-associated protein Cas2